ncbi:MAG: DUF2586 family protein [Bacteroidia bacterium]
MGLPNVTINIGNGALGRRNPSKDMVSAMIGNGVSPGSSPLLQLGTSYQLKSTNDAVTLGIDADYDTTNNVLVHHHIKEFFRMNPDGELWIMLLADTVSLTDMLDVANTSNAAKLLLDAGGNVRRLGAFRCPATNYTPTTTDGIDADVLTAIAKAKALKAQEDAAHRNLGGIIIEGRSFTGSATNAEDLVGGGYDADGVAVTILQDYDVAATHAIHAGYAALGTVLGSRSKAKVNEDTMWVEKFNLQDMSVPIFENVSLSSNLLLSSYSDTDLGTLHDKGYIFGRKYVGVDGVYLNSNKCATAASSDYAYLPDNEVIAKAARLIYAALVPKLGNPVSVDTTTGKLDRTFVAYLERLGHTSLSEMETGQEISGKDVFVDPDQNVLSTSEITLKFSITPTGTARAITADLSFTNPFV